MANQYINKVIYGNRTLIDLTGDTVEAAKILTGYTAHDKSGAPITGSCAFDVNSTDGTAAVAEILVGKEIADTIGCKVGSSIELSYKPAVAESEGAKDEWAAQRTTARRQIMV